MIYKKEDKLTNVYIVQYVYDKAFVHIYHDIDKNNEIL